MSGNERTNTLTGTWKAGQIILDELADWPDGCRVSVVPVPGQADAVGITEEQWPRTPEAIAEWLAWFDSIEPTEMTPEEEVDWRAAREARNVYEVAKFEERAREFEVLFP